MIIDELFDVLNPPVFTAETAHKDDGMMAQSSLDIYCSL